MQMLPFRRLVSAPQVAVLRGGLWLKRLAAV